MRMCRKDKRIPVAGLQNPELLISSLLMHCYEIYEWLNDQMAERYSICHKILDQNIQNPLQLTKNSEWEWCRYCTHAEYATSG